MRAVFQWNLGSRVLELGKRTLVMGVVNVTPDSFSDGGKFADSERAADHALKLLEDGADMVDIGGEATRPGAKVNAAATAPGSSATQVQGAVSESEELERILPVIEKVRKAKPAA